MRKDLRLIGSLVLGFAVVALLLLVAAGGGEGKTITVDDDGEAEYSSIQDAINASEEGDTIRVWEGTYYEDVFVNTPISIVGNGTHSTIFNQGRNTTMIIIRSDDVTIKGLSFVGLWVDNEDPPSSARQTTGRGIEFTGDNCTIEEVRFEKMDFGMWDINTNWSSIIGCHFSEGFAGIEVGSPSQLEFINCSFSGQDRGLIMGLAEGNSIENCAFRNNSIGLMLIMSRNNTIGNCEFSQNSNHGIFMDEGSSNNTIMNSSFINNSIGMTFGVNSPDCTVHYNVIEGNSNAMNVFSNHLGGQVDARFNWWGNESGPYHSEKNRNGKGDRIGDNVTFRPWLLSDGSESPIEKKEEDSNIELPVLVSGVLTITIVGMLGAVYIREDIRFLLLALLPSPLYTKLGKDEILDQPKRQEVYSYIVNQPGSNLTNLHRKLPFGYGTLVHHLKVLEREKHIRSKKEMGRKMFYPTGTDWVDASRGERETTETIDVVSKDTIPDSSHTPSAISAAPREETSAKSTSIQSGAGGGPDLLDNLSSVPVGLRILEHLKEWGPATQADISNKLDTPLTTVSYNLRNLVEEGKVEKTQGGQSAEYKIIEESSSSAISAA